MARYKLMERAVIDGQLLEAGTEIGEGTQYPFDGKPGPYMQPLDSAARLAVKAAQDEKFELDKNLANHPSDTSRPGFLR